MTPEERKAARERCGRILNQEQKKESFNHRVTLRQLVEALDEIDRLEEQLAKWAEHFVWYGKHCLGCPAQWGKDCHCGFVDLQALAAELEKR